MNGVHDLGGLDGMGPVNPDPNEPLFHAEWEKRVFGMFLPIFACGYFNLDELRHAIFTRRYQPGERLVEDKLSADLGVSLTSVGRALETMLGSRIVTTYVDRGREYNVIVQGRDDLRQTSTDLTNIRVRSPRTQELIPLSSIVRLEETSGTMQLSRFNRLRSIKIQADLAPGYTMGEAVQWFRDTVAKELPGEASLAFDGESGDFVRTGQQLYFTFLLALAVVYLVLAAQFESFVHPLIIMVTVPLALLGAVFGLKLFGLTINIFSQIAVIMLIGIAAKNGVLIVEFANQLRDQIGRAHV